MYLNDHLSDVVEFAKSGTDNNTAILYFEKLTQSEETTIQTQATYLVEHFSKCCNLLQLLESSSLPLASTLGTKLDDMSKLFSLLSGGFFFQNTSEILETLSKQSQQNLTSQFKSLALKCFNKLEDLRGNDTAKEFIRAVGTLFDPRNVIQSVPSDISSLVKCVPILNQLAPSVYLEAYSIFRDTVKKEAECGNNADVLSILFSMRSDFPSFVESAVQAMWIPVSNVDCERAFSSYGNIMTDKRTSVTAENMELMTALAFTC